VREVLRGWRRKEGKKEEFRRERKEYKMCERRKKEGNERWERRAEEATRESEVWEIINNERKRRRRINEGIGMNEWREQFMRVLGGVEERVVRGNGREGGG